MIKPKQQLLGIAAPKISKGRARFEAETIRRGGSYEVMGKRRRGAIPEVSAEPIADIAALMPRLGKMR